jgi:hypothetical protein
MRRLAVLLGGGLGAGALWQRLRRRSVARERASDPAAELRARLAESKASAGVSAPRRAEAHEETALDPASRRRAIHERARGSIDELG